MNEPICLESPRPIGYSWWIGPSREGFTQFAAVMMHVPIPVEDVTAEEAEIFVRSRAVMAVLIGYQQAKSNHEIRTAVVVRRKHLGETR